MQRISQVMLIVILAAAAFGQSVAKVGIKRLNFVDESRPNWTGTGKRPLATTVWYPASDDARSEELSAEANGKPTFIFGSAARDAKLSDAKKRYPLILLSHGTGGSAMTLMWLGQYLAERGYIVVGVDHHGNTASEPDSYNAQGFMLWWERADDLKVAADKMLSDDFFGKRIDRKRIGAAGFSLGGTTVVSLAGGVFDINGFEKFCASPERDSTCDPQPEFTDAMKQFEELRKTDVIVIASLKRAEISHRDARIKAVFAISPALGSSFTEASLKSIKIPFQFVVGESDTTAPPKTNAQKLASAIKGSGIIILPGKVAHYTMLSECTDFGKAILPFCADDPSVKRGEIHHRIAEIALQFFARSLR